MKPTDESQNAAPQGDSLVVDDEAFVAALKTAEECIRAPEIRGFLDKHEKALIAFVKKGGTGMDVFRALSASSNLSVGYQRFISVFSAWRDAVGLPPAYKGKEDKPRYVRRAVPLRPAGPAGPGGMREPPPVKSGVPAGSPFVSVIPGALKGDKL